MISLTVEGALATCTLSRPPVNAIDEEWLARLNEALGKLARASEIGALHIRSTERAFCAGADLALMRSRMESADARARFVEFVREMQRVFARLEQLPQVTIAEIGTNALGGGLELALCCDLRIAAQEARIGLPETGLGLLPGAGGTQRLARIAGEATAKRLILGAEVVDGAQAAALGILHWAVPANDLAEFARSIARRISTLPAVALGEAKRCIAAAAPRETPGYEMELEATARLLEREETQRRVHAFLEKRR